MAAPIRPLVNKHFGNYLTCYIIIGLSLLVCNDQNLFIQFPDEVLHPTEPAHVLSSLQTIPHPPDLCLYYWMRHVRCRWLIDRPVIKDRSTLCIILLLIGGIESNPGPRRPKFPCGICGKACKLGSIACDDCDQWIHRTCVGMSTTEFSRLGASDASWYCPNCKRPNNSSIVYSVPDSSEHNSQSFSQSVSDISLQSRSSVSSDHIDSTFNISDANIVTSSPKPTKSKGNAVPRKNNLRIINVNFQSLRKKGKLLESIILDCDPDIILGTETWLDGQVSSSEILPTDLGYDIQRRDRPHDPHGGVLIAAKRHLLLQDLHRSNSVELISGTIKSGSKNIHIATYYRPPNRTDSDYLTSSVEEIANLKKKAKKNIFVIGGDFNIPDIDWKNLTTSGSQYPKSTSKAFLDLISDNSLEQIVDFPTRKDRILDIILTSHPSFKQRCKPMPSIGNSDHDIVLLDTSITNFRPRPQRRKILLWKKADLSMIKEDIRNFATTFISTRYTDIETIWNDFKSNINSIITTRVPTKLTASKYSNPWMNTHIKRAIKRKQKAFKKARSTGTKRDRDRYKRLQQEVQWEVRRANRQYMQDIISESQTKNPKRFWSYIKSKGQEMIGVAPLKNEDGFLRSDNQSKASILNQQFSSVFTREPVGQLPDKGPSSYPTMPDITVSERGVRKLLQNLNCHKASGPDEIPTQILHAAADELAPILAKLFQFSLDSGKTPQDWRDAHVVPIYKKGDRHIPANYRPVSLTSITCKLLEHIIHSNVMSHFDANNILTDKQHGFRKRRSCESQLIVTIDNIAKHLATGDQVDVILLDFEKAFDKVPHSRLLLKLHYYGVRGPVRSWIESFLTNRKQQVVLDGTKSSKDDVLSGVPQGTVLGPLLFLAYINDMPECTSSDIRLFADDSLMYRVIRNDNDRAKLQQDLDALEKWEKTWLMSFNASKCYTIHIAPAAKKPTEYQYRLHNQVLESVDNSKYLGVTVSNNLTWDAHIQNVAANGNRKLGFVKRNLKECTPKVKAASYCMMVRPGLEYAATVWDPAKQTHITTLEQIQRRAARFTTGDYTSKTPGSMTGMLQRLEWDPLEQRRKEARLSMLYRIQHDLVDIDKELYLKPSDSRTRSRFYRERISSQIYANTFFPRTMADWNQLAASVTAANTLEGFRASLHAASP